MKLHELKTDSILFDDVWAGNKTFEIRYNDRNFQVGDFLWLRKTMYSGKEMKQGRDLIYMNSEITAKITYILTGYGLKNNWCILGIDVIERIK